MTSSSLPLPSVAWVTGVALSLYTGVYTWLGAWVVGVYMYRCV